jgi:small subunit ribosomal protein S13
MPRIQGVDLPENKRIDIALTYIYGIGRSNVVNILKEANVDASLRAKTLSHEEVARLQRVIEKINTEGNLRKQIRENIERLKRIGCYRGGRHISGLPVRGQRTRTNARTKRGKRMTIGAISKDQKSTPAPADNKK